MEVFRTRLRRVGSSLGVIVPKRAVDELHKHEGDEIEVALLPLPEERKARLREAIGRFPGLAPFERERNDRF